MTPAPLALTVCQPYASAILHTGPDGARLKTVENRSWPTQRRGLLYIHAGKSRSYLDDYLDWRFDPLRTEYPRPEDLPMGRLLGTVQLVDCLDEAAGRALDPLFAFGPWCFVLDDPIRLPRPIPCLGALGFWPVPSSLSSASPVNQVNPVTPVTPVPASPRTPDPKQLTLF